MGENHILVEEMNEQPDIVGKEGSAYSDHVARVLAQMPPSYISASFSSCESYYSNIVNTLRVGGRPMSPSNRLVVITLAAT